MIRTPVLAACAALMFVFSFLSVKPFLQPRMVAIGAPKADATAGYNVTYANAKTLPEYFVAVLSDPRLKIDSVVVRIMTSKKKGKIDYGFLFADSSVQKGKRFMQKRRTILANAYRKYGVPPNFTTAVLKLETDLGDFVGNHLVVNSLFTICLTSPKRSKSAAEELWRFLELSKKNGWDPLSIKSSWAGAFGIPQFMPRSFDYAVDGNGDEIVDLFNEDDAIMSAGNFLKIHGWRDGDPASEKKALRSYNKGSYADAVIKYAAMLEKTR